MGSGEKKIVAVLVVVLVGLAVAYLKTQPKTGEVRVVDRMAAMGTPTATSGSSDASCATGSSSGGAGVATQEFGKKGAKLEIVAALPITHGCHVQTEAELKKAYEQHKGDIHLTIYDLFGTDGQAFVAKHGGARAVIFINDKTSFELGGQPVVFERQENQGYQPAQIVPVIEQELKKS